MDNKANSEHAAELAPWLQIPARSVAVIEHPCIVKNLDKGIDSLGGAVKLSNALRSKAEPSDPSQTGDGPSTLKLTQFLSASLRPEDPYAKHVLAQALETNNILLKVTVPRRTGRKRKRGSSGPFLGDHDVSMNGHAPPDMPHSSTPTSQYADAQTVFRSIRDNPTKYEVTPVGIVDETHRFRALPDIQVATYRNELLTKIREATSPLRLSTIKSFSLNTAPGPDLEQPMPVSAEYLQMPVHYAYKFQQNQFVKYTADSKGEVNIQKRHTVNGYYFIDMNAKSVPTKPKPNLPPEDTLTPYVQRMIADIRAQLEERPIITRQILYNRIGWDKRDRIREAAVFCGYFFTGGPWREALVRWGVDPRKDPSYRKYQTISFISFDKLGTERSRYNADRHLRELAQTDASELRNQHIFDGVTVGHTGNIFMFCDITDPMIRKVLDTKDIRSTCAPTFQGWYHIGTWAKATVILKDKMNRIIKGEPPDPELYERALSWPEIWDDAEVRETYNSEVYDKELHRKKGDEHHLLNAIRWAAKSPRYAFERIERTNSTARFGEENASENIEDSVEGADIEEAEVEVPEDLTEARDDENAILQEGGEDEEQSSSEDEGEFDDEEEEEEPRNVAESEEVDQDEEDVDSESDD
ncbi:hypothetical protein M011DRAFT_489681 [Sporormia fimetaria CBS 119925]|uniref:Uncharacterized protein n=1 Tax=Sporormia fimetaria CBS 119925 TaxID=1340428 RepID=A0A6A6V2N1_9PLEO|nr:hypothetical protein M011DRAFT_489681 [Sporormia fimetaria CBS 119925]